MNNFWWPYDLAIYGCDWGEVPIRSIFYDMQDLSSFIFLTFLCTGFTMHVHLLLYFSFFFSDSDRPLWWSERETAESRKRRRVLTVGNRVLWLFHRIFFVKLVALLPPQDLVAEEQRIVFLLKTVLSNSSQFLLASWLFRTLETNCALEKRLFLLVSF